MAVAISVAKRHPLTLFFILVFLFSWFFSPLVKVMPVMAVAAMMMPSASAWLVSNLGEGRFGAIKLGNRLKNWRTEPFWYLMALGIPALASLAAAFGGRLVGARAAVQIEPVTPMILIIFLMAAGEEIGWRGYALPKLLDGFHPLAASIILGMLYAIWRIPAFLIAWMPEFGAPLEAFLVISVALSIIFTWIYQNTRGSLLLATLLHAAANLPVFSNTDLAPEQRWYLLAAIYLILAALVVLVAGPDLTRRQASED